jgi:putative oxidoreductase
MASVTKDLVGTWSPRILGVLRIVSGLMFFEEGTAKLFHWPHVALFDKVQLLSLLGMAGVMDVVGGFLLVVGLFTRWAAFILSGEMAFAYFIVFQPRGLFPVQNGGGDTILLCFILLYVFASGGGAFTLDGLIRAQKGNPSVLNLPV